MFVDRLRRPTAEESGFTLVELLVVMVILALLASIAIPSFLGQRAKGHDADAKSAARSAQVAIEAYAIDNEGSYAGADIAALEASEATLAGRVQSVTATKDTYEIIAASETGNGFTIARAANGTTSATCTTPGSAGCSSSGGWG